MKLFLCCKKTKPYLTKAEYYVCDENKEYTKFLIDKSKKDLKIFGGDILNGKVLAECDFKIEEIACGIVEYKYSVNGCGEAFFENSQEDNTIYLGLNISYRDLLKKSCFTPDQLENYLGTNSGYIFYIEDLNIYEEPKNASSFKRDFKKDEPCEFERTGFPSAIQPSMKYYISLGKNENSKFELLALAKDLEDIPNVLKSIYYYDEEVKHWKQGYMLTLDSIQMENILNKKQTIIIRKSIPKALKP